jgi:hypothetical protein
LTPRVARACPCWVMTDASQLNLARSCAPVKASRP